MNIDKFDAAFTAALLQQKESSLTSLPSELYDHAAKLGNDMSSYVRVDEAEERRKLKAALDQEKRNGEYLRLRSPVAGKPQKTGKAERKARLLAAQRRAVVGK